MTARTRSLRQICSMTRCCTATFPTLAPGQTATVKYTVVIGALAGQLGTVTNAVSVSADNPVPNPNTTTTSVPLQVFDVCLQDYSNPDVVFLRNSVTGDYRFCCNGTVFSSRATVSEGQHHYLRAQRRGPARIGRGEMRSAPGLIKGMALPPALLEKPVCWSG